MDDTERLILPMTRIVKFAVATAMRLGEICRVEWTDLDVDRRRFPARDRKDQRNTSGIAQQIPVFAATSFNTGGLAAEQAKKLTQATARIFPNNARSGGATLRHACVEVELKDLRHHDVRHESASRLFEAGFAMEQVSLGTGHEDWKVPRCCTHIRPATLHRLAASRPAPPLCSETRRRVSRE